MKTRITILTTFLLFCFVLNAQQLKIMSFNIQQPYGSDWEGRQGNVVNIINTHQPDVIGTQEAHKEMADYIKANCPGYEYFGRGRECNESGEGSFIFYKTDKYNLDVTNSGSFWFKDSWWECGDGWDPQYKRICSFVRIIEKSSGKGFYVYNSHFPTPGYADARYKSAQLLCSRVNERTVSDPVILTGDFNSPEGDATTNYFKLEMRDTYRDVHPSGGGNTYGSNTKLDYIYVPKSSNTQTIASDIIYSPKGSDHYPIWAKLNLGGETPSKVFNIPTKIEAEEFSNSYDVDLESCSEGGKNVGWINDGSWMEYKVNVPTAGKYKVSYRIASQIGGGKLRLDTDAGNTVFGIKDVPNTTEWQKWETITQVVDLPAGDITLGIYAIIGGFNINWIDIQPEENAFYTKIEAENYVAMSGIDIDNCSEGGEYVGWIDQGDWMAYSVNIPSERNYTITYRVASQNGGAQFRLDKDAGNTVLDIINVDATNDWQNWESISHTVSLPAGQYNIGINALQSGFNLNWIEISSNALRSAKPDLNSEEITADFSVFPNPCVDRIIIEGVSEQGIITLTDISGKVLLSFKVQNDNTELDVSDLKKGLYVLHYSNNKDVIFKKIIKQ